MYNLFIEPYNYLLSYTEYLPILDINSISNIFTIINENTSKTYQLINDTIESSFNDINDINKMSISDITMNDINYVLYKYKIVILLTVLSFIITVYFMNNLIDKYFAKIENKNNKNNKNKTYKNYNNNTLKINTLKINKLNDSDNDSDNVNIQKTITIETQKPIQMNNVIFNKERIITRGLFIDSILEINANNKNICNKLMVNKESNNNYYYALLRIKLKHNITLNKTNYTIQAIIVNSDNDAETFSTSDMYMIIKFYYNNTDIRISQMIINVINFLNYLTHDIYKNEDFIVLAISKDSIHNNTKPNEFYNGLHNIKYDLRNIKQMNLNRERTIGFTLLLPIKQVYELFLDVYNDIIFESTSYKIDFDNNECWYNNSMTDIF